MKQRQRPKIPSKSAYSSITGRDSDDSAEEAELFVQKPQYREVPTIDKIIEEGDTLQSLSIRYHCPIAELKRINNIHKENEIFAKRVVKVPSYTLLRALAGVHSSGTSSPNESAAASVAQVDAETLKSKLGNTFPIESNNSKNGIEVNKVIFNSSIKPINKPSINLQEHIEEDTYEEEIRLLPPQEVPAASVVQRMSCSGADADISWIALFAFIVILVFAVPLIYVFYIAEHPEQYHHSHNS